MGIFAILAFVVIGLPLLAIFVGVTHFLTRGRPHRSLALGTSLLLIPVVCLYLGGASWAWNGWLGVRQLDPGILDTFRTPLGFGYYATSGDSWKPDGILEGPEGRMDWGVQRAGCAGDEVVLQLVGRQPSPRYAQITRQAPHYQEFADQAAFNEAVSGPVTWSADRVPPPACAPRLGVLDQVVGRVLWGIPLVWLFGGVFLVWAVYQEKQPGTARRRRITAGFLAVSLGAFGVHLFYLDRERSARNRLALGLIGIGLGLAIVPLFIPLTLGVIGVVEGMQLFRSSDQDAQPPPAVAL